MKSFILLIAILSLPSYAYKKSEWGPVINKAGKQRMLSQKMAKEFALILLNKNKSANEEALSKTMKLFDTTLKELKQDAPNDEIKTQLNLVNDHWKKYKKLLSNHTKKDLGTVYKTSIKVLKEMNNGVQMYAKASREAGIKGKGKAVNIAGRQRMLTQRMTKEALFMKLGLNPQKMRNSIRKTIALFSKSLNALLNGSEEMGIYKIKYKMAKSQLLYVNMLWSDFKPLIDKVAANRADDIDLDMISKNNIPLLKEMNKAVGLIAQGK